MDKVTVVETNWPTLQAANKVSLALELMDKFDVDYLPVLVEGKLVGELRLSAMVRSTLMDIREVAVKHIMSKPKLTVAGLEHWQDWAKLVTEVVPVVTEDAIYLGITTPDLINNGFRKMLQRHLERFQAVLDCTHNGIMAIDLQGKLTLFNIAASRVLGIKIKEAIGKPVDSLFPKTGLLEVVKTGQAQYSKQISHGNKVFISNRTPIVSEGKVIGAVAVFQDISDLARVSQQLELVKELNEELDAIIQYSHDGICITDQRGVILRLNPAFERVTGLKNSKYLGEGLEAMLAEKVMDNSATLKVLQNGEPATVMQRFNTGKQTISTAYPILDDNGAITRVVTNLRDVTELNLLRQQLEESKQLTNKYLTELSQLKKESEAVAAGIIGHSMAMERLLEVALRVAQVDATVLLLGESGVGKENIAKFIHLHSSRRESGALIKLNCGAIPRDLLESELFGYERGAFTGARKEGKLGFFELANNGTLFLDEVADLPLELQVKLLRVLQEQEIVRLGGEKPIKIDVRIIAATNRNLEEMSAVGEFRQDLYYRLNVFPIQIPPLRDRKQDIELLVKKFINKFNSEYGRNVNNMDNKALSMLKQYDWPGNVRELENIIGRA
ncbi:MAG: sigma 54-interacting transcriptional regulator, partial [Bacillota bacterium]|nr:sigma 54-interacting transcriptional regulator [Bacillota bacterium]